MCSKVLLGRLKEGLVVVSYCEEWLLDKETSASARLVLSMLSILALEILSSYPGIIYVSLQMDLSFIPSPVSDTTLLTKIGG